MEKNLEGSNIIIDGENLIGKDTYKSQKIFGMSIPVPYEITEDMVADKITLPNGSCFYRLTTFIN